jgi:tetratricopeptide (TPR) repeat protein
MRLWMSILSFSCNHSHGRQQAINIGGTRSDIPARTSHRVARAQLTWIGAFLLCVSGCVWALPASVEAASPQGESNGPIAVEANPQVFATMCALVAAGFETDSTSTDPDLAQLQAHLRSLHGPATEALRDYYSRHVLGDSGATLSRFMTFALVAGPAPQFEPVLRGEALPPGAAALEGFSDVLAKFYQEAQIEALWQKFEPAYERAASNLRGPLSEIVLVSTAYLREIIRPGVRTFRVYVEPMVGNETNVRNIGDRYIVVMNPASSSFDLMRHAFLHYLLDPLPIRYRDKLTGEQPLLLLADRAPNLPYEYRTDLTSFFDECFVRAVEFRVRRLPPTQLAEEANSAEANGYVLVPPLLKALSKFEKSEPSMSLYFLDLVHSIDVVSEQQRLQTVKFAPAADSFPARERAEGLRTKSENAENTALDLESELSAAERLIAEQDASGAAEAFERILLKTPGQPRAVYGLAVASILEGDAERAITLFDQVVASAQTDSPQMRPEPSTLAWSHIYLGRMHDLQDDREQALQEYRAALAVQNAPETARSAAQHGIDQAYRPAVTHSPPE